MTSKIEDLVAAFKRGQELEVSLYDNRLGRGMYDYQCRVILGELPAFLEKGAFYCGRVIATPKVWFDIFK